MKYFITFIALLLITKTTLIAETDSFIELNADFHKFDVKELSKGEKSALCFNCHLFDTKKGSDTPSWLNPQKNITGTINNFDDSNGAPDPFSKACLMCHDGSLASLVINAPLSPCGLKGSGPVSQNGANHPVFMKYASKRDLHQPSTKLNGKWNEAEQVGDLLREEKIVCISCHSPHHNEDSGYLRTSMRGSGLCIGCHKK